MTNTYIISDTHFKHANIIKYQNRPFDNVDEMDNIMFDNWNSVINYNDIVYFLGDLCMGNPSHWLENLNGTKVMIRGNHDKQLKNAHKYKIVEWNKEKLLLVHNPEFLPFNWNGWILHGHVHTNNLLKYPLINSEFKTINCSVEMLDYKPIELNALLNKRKL